MLKTFFRRILILLTLIIILFLSIQLTIDYKGPLSDDMFYKALMSAFLFFYIGFFPIILSSISTAFLSKNLKISNTPLKRDVLFGLIIVILIPIFFLIYAEFGMLAA